jgi:hypothetical protein
VRQSEQIDAWKSCIQIKYRISMRLSALNTAFPCMYMKQWYCQLSALGQNTRMGKHATYREKVFAKTQNLVIWREIK